MFAKCAMEVIKTTWIVQKRAWPHLPPYPPCRLVAIVATDWMHCCRPPWEPTFRGWGTSLPMLGLMGT